MAYDLLRPVPLLLFVNAGLSVGLAAYVASYRRRNVTRGLVAVLAGAGIWSLADGLRIAAPTHAEVLLWNKVTYVGVGLVAPGTLLFVAAFTDRDRWLRPRRLYPLLGISLGMLVVVFTNQWHGLWRPSETITLGAVPVVTEELGTLHLVWVAYVLLFVVPLTYVYLLKEFRASTRSQLHRQQIGLVLLAVTGPVITSTLYVLGATPIDYTPFGFTLFGIGLTVAITKFRMLDIVPIARDTVVEHVESGVLVLDEANRVVDANPAARRIVGQEEATLVGRDLLDIVGESTFTELEGATDDPINVEVHEDGETWHYRATASSVEDVGGYRVGRVVIFSDVTEAVEREERLLAQTAALERKNEQLDEFASVLSHDLRNPLSIASLRLEQVETDDEAELASAREALDRIERMTEQLLTLARAGTDVDTTEAVDLDSAVTRAWETIGTDSATLEAAADLGEVQGSPALVLELLENLFHNAVDHNDDGVTVAVGRVDGGRTGFYVADDGSGIDEADRDRIFDHGYSTDQAGTGYGLAIVEDIVEAHDWRIDVTQSADGGARFEVLTDGDSPDGGIGDAG